MATSGPAGQEQVSAEAIYLRVAADRRGGGELFRLLRQVAQTARDRCGTRRGHRFKVRPDQQLSQRPAVIDERARVGDWEVDLIIGAGQRGAVLVAVERRTRFCRLRLLGDKSAPGVASALLSALKGMPVASMTKDRGLEWAEHERIARRLEAILNARPRRVLGYATPAEVMLELG